MRRLLVLTLPLAAAATLAAGCGGGSSSSASPPPPPPPATTPQPPPPPPPTPPPVKPWRTFTVAELSKIALQSQNAPADLVYVREESGPKKLSDELILPRQQREVRSFGYLGMYDASFDAKDRTSDRRVTQRIWLFKSRNAASRWLQHTKQQAVDLQFVSVDAPRLGEESWAARGIIQFGGGQSITHNFRLGNAVFVVHMYGERTVPTEEGALAAAKAALARAKAAS